MQLDRNKPWSWTKLIPSPMGFTAKRHLSTSIFLKILFFSHFFLAFWGDFNPLLVGIKRASGWEKHFPSLSTLKSSPFTWLHLAPGGGGSLGFPPPPPLPEPPGNPLGIGGEIAASLPSELSRGVGWGVSGHGSGCVRLSLCCLRAQCPPAPGHVFWGVGVSDEV